MDTNGAMERFDTVVIGGGQAGLSVGYYLAGQGRAFVVLDAYDRIGDAWRTRWDSLKLFTPARYDGLPGWPFPAGPWSFPSKDAMADYLAEYAARFEIPVRTGVSVDGLTRDGERYVVSAGDDRFEADHVVVATGAHRIPKVPDFALELDPGIAQLHSSAYQNPSQLQDGGVLLVGAGNSGAEIGIEVARSHPCLMAGPDTGHIPVRHGSAAARFVFPLVRYFGHNVARVDTRIGRKVAPKILSGGDPLIRVKPKDLIAAGIERVPRVVGVKDGRPVLEDDRVADVANVIWCTGFRSNFGWIDLPAFDEDGEPLHDRGVVTSEPGLFFVGLIFQYSISSDVLPNQGRDAGYIADQIASRERDPRLGGKVPSGR